MKNVGKGFDEPVRNLARNSSAAFISPDAAYNLRNLVIEVEGSGILDF